MCMGEEKKRRGEAKSNGRPSKVAGVVGCRLGCRQAARQLCRSGAWDGGADGPPSKSQGTHAVTAADTLRQAPLAAAVSLEDGPPIAAPQRARLPRARSPVGFCEVRGPLWAPAKALGCRIQQDSGTRCPSRCFHLDPGSDTWPPPS